MRYEAASIYLSRKTGTCLVEQMCSHPRGMGSAALREFTEVRPDEFDARVVDEVIRVLNDYHTPRVPSDLPIESDEQSAALIRDYRVVSITRYESGVIRLVPMRRERGGLMGTREAAIDIPPDEIRARFPAALRRAFESAE